MIIKVVIVSEYYGIMAYYCFISICFVCSVNKIIYIEGITFIFII